MDSRELVGTRTLDAVARYAFPEELTDPRGVRYDGAPIEYAALRIDDRWYEFTRGKPPQPDVTSSSMARGLEPARVVTFRVWDHRINGRDLTAPGYREGHWGLVRVHGPVRAVALQQLSGPVAGSRSILFGIDERSGDVIFEHGHYTLGGVRTLFHRLDLEGFEPRWWKDFDAHVERERG